MKSALFAALLILVGLMIMPVVGWSDTAVAVSGIENAGGDPRHDYLSGIVEGLLLFDLSRSPGVTLVNRGRLEDVLAEQRLSLSGLIQETERAQEVGRLAGADVLVHGSYVFIGTEALFSLTITSVETGTTRAVTDRGATENAIHRLAEKAVAAINGGRVSFEDPDSDRSILSLQDEKPGEIALYSNLVNAEIRLDDNFVGYTTGDPRVPFIISNLSPGIHTVETDLGPDFGVVDLPGVIFRNWYSDVQVRPGSRSVVRASEAHFNTILYDEQKLFRLSKTLYTDRDSVLHFNEDISFTDRAGNKVPVEVRGTADFTAHEGSLDVEYHYAGTQYDFSLQTGADTETIENEIGLTQLRMSIDSPYEGSCDVNVYIDRRDVYQGLHREEGKSRR